MVFRNGILSIECISANLLLRVINRVLASTHPSAFSLINEARSLTLRPAFNENFLPVIDVLFDWEVERLVVLMVEVPPVLSMLVVFDVLLPVDMPVLRDSERGSANLLPALRLA